MSGNLCSLEALSSSFQVHSKPRETSPLEYKATKPHANHLKFQKFNSLAQSARELSNKAIFFHFEKTLLKSPSLFPYFMLVAFEAGGLLRALILKEKMRVGTAVLPKFFLEDVGCEGFDVVMRCGKKVGFSDLPRVMVKDF
ncbi:unnamed protein product [Prunus armeniaca]|uniref:Glycerol-3-phosphate acyltransferase RAM2/GPAT1-8 HAD-like domain-containing protein n=1 Tax=Prunus armeniaca TaxID=36596 RepID=A0A6J5TSS5_PRUAR|nr:unnamed protein product [Prunus armeniaca]